MRSLIDRFWRNESGQDLIEWALLIALVTTGSAALMYQSGSSTGGVWASANAALQGQSQSGTSASSQSSGNGGTGGGSGNKNSHHHGSGGGGHHGGHRHGGDG